MILGWLYLFSWVFVFTPILSPMITVPESFTHLRFFIFLCGVFFIFLPIVLMNRWKKKNWIISLLISVFWYPTAIVVLCLPVLIYLGGDVDVQEIVQTIVMVSSFVWVLSIIFLSIYLSSYIFLATDLFVFFATHLKTKSLGNLSGMVIPDEQSFISSIVHSIMSNEPNDLPDLPIHGWQSILDMSTQRTDGMSIRQDTFAVLATTVSLVSLAVSITDSASVALLDLLVRILSFFETSVTITQVIWLLFGVLAVFMLFVFYSTLKIYKNSFTNEVLQKVCIYNLYEKKRILIAEEQENQPNDTANQQSNHSFRSILQRLFFR